MIWRPGCTEEHPRQPNIEALRNFSLTADIGDSLTKMDTPTDTNRGNNTSAQTFRK